MPRQSLIQFRGGTASQWTSANPVLALGEPGYETDTGLVKYGDGSSAWADLQYSSSGSIQTRVQNATGSNIPKGSVVYISGANGNNPLISLADADTEAASSKTIGITAEAIANGGQGKVIESGILTGINTSTATVGQSVWLSSTAGGMVYGAPPAKPAHSVYLGVVIRVNSNNGAILVKVQNGYELEELHNVVINSPVEGNIIYYSEEYGRWYNGTYAEIGAAAANHTHAIANVSGLQTTLDGKAASSHTHTAAQVTPGTSDKSANYTLVSGDAQTIIRSTGSAITITVPDVLSSGQRIDFIQAGAGQITFAGSGVTINSVDSKLKTNKQYSGATIMKVGTAYYLVGDLAA